MRKLFWSTVLVLVAAAGLPLATAAAAEAPDAPVITSVETRNRLAILTWDAVDGAVSYNVYRNTILLETIPTDEMPYDDINAAGLYTYAVTAVDDKNNESEQSDKVEADTTQQTSWILPDSERRQDEAPVEEPANEQPAAEAVEESVPASVEPEAEAPIVVAPAADAVSEATRIQEQRPTLTAEGDVGLTNLSWDAVDGAAGYNIYRNDQYLTTESTTSNVDRTKPGDHVYYIVAFDSSKQNFSQKSEPVAATVTSREEPTVDEEQPKQAEPETRSIDEQKTVANTTTNAATATNETDIRELKPTLTAVGDVGLTNLSWDAVEGATGYNIYRNDQYLTTESTTSNVDRTQPGDHVYYIVAFDSDKNFSQKSDKVGATVTTKEEAQQKIDVATNDVEDLELTNHADVVKPFLPATANLTACTSGKGGIYDSADKAKENYEADCGRPFQNTTAFRCDWVDEAKGWQCSGPTESPSVELPETPAVTKPLLDRPAIVVPDAPAVSVPELSSVVVSMGDSYISGESGHMIGNNSGEKRSGAYEAGTEGGCRRSDVAPIQSADISGMSALNIACSGATTSDIGSLNQPSTATGRFGERLQIHQLQDIAATNNVEMVIVSVGGNDIGFDKLVAACAAAYVTGTNCERLSRYYEAQVNNTLRPRVSENIEDIKRVLNNAGQSNARIVLVSYPSPVPASASYDQAQRFNHGCPFSSSDMLYINGTFVPLIDSTLRGVADNRGVEFLSLSNAFDGKELCSPKVTSRDNTSNQANLEWATGIRTTSNNVGAESMHPNALGQRAIGRCVGLVWNSNARIHKCYNNGGGPTGMRLGGSPTGSPTNLGTVAACSNASTDPDGDGWGFENGLGCTVTPDITAEDVDCKDVEGTEAELCELFMDHINNELEVGRLSLDKDGLLFTYSDPTKERINTGCTTRAYVTGKTATARIGSDVDLNLSGNALTEPVALQLKVPFALNARVGGQTKLGWRKLWPLKGCGGTYATDNYSAKAAASGTADLLVALDLAPEIGPNANGELVLTIEPRAHVAMDLHDPHLNFKISKTNPLVQFTSFLTSLTTLVYEGLEEGVEGDSVGDSLSGNALNVGLPVGLTLLDVTTSTFVWNLIENAGERELQQAAQNISPDLEKELNKQLSEALELDENGKREFVVPADFARLLQQGATLEQLLAQAG